jgi:hypothetical protein
MEKLSRDINSLENSVAKYIYIKYIQEHALDQVFENKDSSSSSSSSSYDNDNNDNNDNNVVKPLKPKQKPNIKVARLKVLDKTAYTIYCKNIFHQSRSCFALNQDDLIREDIRIMRLADKAYEEHPVEFKVGDFELPPDILRCSFIRKHHHRYYRCRNQIMNKDNDICKKHENSENIYYDNYNDLLESLNKP